MVSSSLWSTIYEPKTVPILTGKKRQHVIDIIGALAICGPSTTYEIAQFVLSKNFSAGESKERTRETPKLASEYLRLLERRLAYQHAGKKLDKYYPGLIQHGFVKKVGTKTSQRGNPVGIYFLTLKGSFLAMGYRFSISDLKKAIKNAARISLYFSYIEAVLDKTSYGFAKRIFINPLIIVIKRSRIFLDDDIAFYFSNIAERTSHALSKEFATAFALFYQTDIELSTVLKKIGIEDLLDETRYTINSKEDWIDSLIEEYYHKDKQEEFYRSNTDELYESRLVYSLMRAIHFTYYENLEIRPPSYSRKKIPRSKRWKEHQKLKYSTKWVSEIT